MRAPAYFLAALTLVACGPSLMATPQSDTPSTKAPAVVEVLDGDPSRPAVVVGLAVAELDTEGSPPNAPTADLVAEMRAMAAARNADALVVELLETRWRRAYYGTMLRYAGPGETPTPPPTCDHPDTVAALADAQKQALACLGQAKKNRPALIGKVTIVFEVDAFGGIRRAAPTPDSSRDTQVQMCVLEPLFVEKAYGPAKPFSCRSEVTVEVPEKPPADAGADRG